MSVTSVTNTSTVNKTEQSQVVAPKETDTEDSASEGEFEQFLRGLLPGDSASKVNEEELFAAVMQERVKALKGEEGVAAFKEAFERNKAAIQKPDGYISFEDAAKQALRDIRTAGVVTSEEADKIYSESFSAAQLDGNTNALYDGRGGVGDTTIATELLETALGLSRALIEKFSAGTESAAVRTLDGSTPAGVVGVSGAVDSAAVTPEGEVVDGADGFLFKPASSTDGRLAILLPEIMAHNVISVILKDELGNTLEEGNSTGYGELGTREKFAFTKPGQEYPDNLVVEVTMNDGTTKQYNIPDPAKRYD